jgi:hypothetical protein
MKLWKVAAIVWGPLVVLALIYSAVYFVHYKHAKDIYNEALVSYNSCMNPLPAAHVDKQTGAITFANNSGTPTFVPNCLTAGKLGHGFLYLPKYQQGSYN